jgi:type II secretory pathway component PulL
VLLLRIIGLLSAIALGASVLLWLMTGERKWLTLAWRIFRVVVFVVLLILLLFLGERLLQGI